MKIQAPFFLILLSCCPLRALESHQTALYIPHETLNTLNQPPTFATLKLCATCGSQLCEQCIESNQISQSKLTYTLEEQHRTIALQQKALELQSKKINSLQSELNAAALQRETLSFQQSILDLQRAQISSLHHQLEVYASNQQEIEQLRGTIAELRELLIPLQKENENRFTLMAKRSTALQELKDKNIPLQYALLATLAEIGRGKRDSIWHRIGQPQHFITRTLSPLSQETKDALEAWISLP